MRFLVYLAFVVLISAAYNLYSNKVRKLSDTIGSIVFFGSIVLCFAINWYGTSHYGDRIGNFFEKSNYDAQYYVYVSDNPNSSKHYKLVADIRRGEGSYYLLTAYWPNGGTLSFEYAQLFVNAGSYLYGDNDKEWRIELTTQRVTKKG